MRCALSDENTKADVEVEALTEPWRVACLALAHLGHNHIGHNYIGHNYIASVVGTLTVTSLACLPPSNIHNARMHQPQPTQSTGLRRLGQRRGVVEIDDARDFVIKTIKKNYAESFAGPAPILR